MDRVLIREVGPRDGLQNEAFVPTEKKLQLIQRLAKAGCKEIEVTSFVSPKWVPQFADATELANASAGLDQRESLILSALVPNQRGLDSFSQLERPLEEVCFFIGATDSFNRKNVNRSTQEHLDAFRPVLEEAIKQDLGRLAYISVVCGCPYEGAVSPERVADLAEQLYQMGFRFISLGDTIGIGTPAQVSGLVSLVREKIPAEALIFHAHDTYGRGVANVWAAYEQGLRIFDSSIGGLGGCPYAPGARGNVATEDLVDLFERSSISTGIELERLCATIDWMRADPDFPSQIGGRSYQAYTSNKTPSKS